MSFFKKLFGAMSNRKYRKNPKGCQFTAREYTACNIGAINAEQTMYFCDSLETGAGQKELAANLAQYYGITNEASAIEILDWLKNRGHSVYFEAIKQLAAGASTAVNDSILEDGEKHRTYQLIRNLNEAAEVLPEHHIIRNKSQLADISILAWDMGRLVLLSRCCYELGYFSEELAWVYILFALDKCRNTYADWSEFARGYLTGRCMWSGADNMISGLLEIAKGLLEDADSSWLQYPLQ